MMTGTVLDILIYVFDRYMLDEVPEVPEREHLARDLERVAARLSTDRVELAGMVRQFDFGCSRSGPNHN